jgi:hypothetical protein
MTNYVDTVSLPSGARVRATGARRGEWDGLMLDEDAHWLFNAFTQSPDKRDIKIGRGTHLMHLERMRTALWRESVNFLLGQYATPIPK